MAYTKWTTEQKREFARNRKFSKPQLESYRKGKRYGFLQGVHAPKRTKG